MIDIDVFIKYLETKFDKITMSIEEFNPDMWFVDIDCFPKQDYKLTLQILKEDIKVATLSKKPELDFSLYDYVFEDNEEARNFIDKIVEEKEFPLK